MSIDNRRELQRINRLYLAWHRCPGDMEGLRRLHEAIEEYLAEVNVSH